MVGFLSMGGYWPFVWPAYGAAALGLGGLLALSIRWLRANEAALARLERERPRRSVARSGPAP
ncbi:MAG: heme exporter protein CcmD [Alphaproteobacteria bacterium]|nr:heme exporter protein CcmD [Alphaproteobacteria bacterium]